ncbi:hypothetical protein [Agromyces sp. NPDC055658]
MSDAQPPAGSNPDPASGEQRYRDGDRPTAEIQLDLINADPEVAAVVQMAIGNLGVGSLLVAGLQSLLPESALWRLTVTTDIATTVDRLEGRDLEAAYTTNRGAGFVGGRTIKNVDGSYDIVVSADALIIAPESADTPEAVLEHAFRAAAHLGVHEAGHVLLDLRGEDADRYSDLPTQAPTAHAWRKYLASHLDDHRIEQMARAVSPSPNSQLDHLAKAIAHFRAELNWSRQNWRDDIGAAASRTMIAANDLIRVLTYLSAELGIEDGYAVTPDPAPPGWDEYVGPFWQRWSLAFHEARPADIEMSREELADVLKGLCPLVREWLHGIGVDWDIDELDRESIYWRRLWY